MSEHGFIRFFTRWPIAWKRPPRGEKRVVVLDRPNPLGGGDVEGNLLQDDCASFVGLYPLPMRHGLTFGELALYINAEFRLEADIEVIPMQGWRRSMHFRETGLPWVFPSPNMPTPETAEVYPGQVIWEGTNVSEGRGTTLPFELVGAPFWEHEPILDFLRNTPLPGCFFRPLIFEPTSGKWAGNSCAGFQIHVTDTDAFLPYRTSIALLQAVMRLYPGEFCYKEPPYEYEYNLMPFDILSGDSRMRTVIEQGLSLNQEKERWREEIAGFESTFKQIALYKE
jgi:uncharacterized protein YbbC (DUF1343 family)